MQKRIRLISVGIVLIVLLIGIIVINNNSNNKYSFTQDGIKYALTLDGEKTNSFPPKGMYKAQVTCENADGRWLYDDWKLAIENITSDDVTCDINFSTITKTNLNDYIISLAGSTEGTGEVVNENGYRYEGKNPNNYIWFNNEYWRIIGVFDRSSHGQDGKHLVKIIRAETLDGLSWDESGANDWTASSLKSLLNGAYYNAQDGTSSEYCYGFTMMPSTNCDYTKKGIQSSYRRMITNVTWHLGGYSSNRATAEEFYEYERSTTVNGSNSTTTTGFIGLMYPSDYGYSILASDCARTTDLRFYNKEICAGASWLYGKGTEWTLTHNSSRNDFVFALFSEGFLYGVYGEHLSVAYEGYGFRPVLYLDASVYKIDGDGSLENPYIVGM